MRIIINSARVGEIPKILSRAMNASRSDELQAVYRGALPRDHLKDPLTVAWDFAGSDRLKVEAPG